MPEALVVEDNPQIAHLVSRLLTRRGLDTVVLARRAEVFTELHVRPRKFALAYVDMGLPDGSGADVVVELRRTNPSVPILFATGDIGNVVVDANVVLRKPFTTAAFDAAVDACGVGRELPDVATNGATCERWPQPA